MTYRNDAPLFDPLDDRLGLAPFGRRLSRVIRGAQLGHNIVIGLNGTWGSGKTSAINFAVAHLMAVEKAGLAPLCKDEAAEAEALTHLLKSNAGSSAEADSTSYSTPELLRQLEIESGQADNETIIIRYNPWLVSGHETLISDFFRLLGNRTAEFSDTDASNDIRRYAREVAAFTERLTGSAEGMMRVVALGLDLSGGGGAATFGLGAAQEALRKIKGTAGSVREKLAENAVLTLQEARDNLKAALKKTPKRFLVIIDDIDRLETDEVRPILSMVKSVGDLPNVTYLLGFDRRSIEHALGEGQTEQDDRPTFLEKVIQIDIELPRISSKLLGKELFRWLPSLLNRELTESEISDLETDLFRGWEMLETPRDLMRLYNSLLFVRMATDRELLITDLVRMELIRLKESNLFDWIMSNQQFFSGSHETHLVWFNNQERHEFIESGLQNASLRRRSICSKWLRRTLTEFRDTSHPYSNPIQDLDHNLGWPLRSPEGWHAYTHLYPHEDTISQDEWGKLKQIQEHEQKCVAYLKTIDIRQRSDEKSMLYSLVDDLRHFFSIDDCPTGLLSALVKQGEDLWWHRNYNWGGTPINTLMHLSDLIPSKERIRLLPSLVGSKSVPLGVAGLMTIELGRPYDFVWPKLEDKESIEQLSEADVHHLADIVSQRIDDALPDDIGWSCRLGPLLEIYEKQRGPAAAAKIAEQIFASNGQGGIGLIMLKASYTIGSEGTSYTFNDVNEDIYPLSAIRTYAVARLKDQKFPEHSQLLEACVKGIDQILAKKAATNSENDPDSELDENQSTASKPRAKKSDKKKGKRPPKSKS